MTISREAILAIPETEPERLFVRAEDVQALYKQLARAWHPDVPTGDAKVFTHLNTLHANAEAKKKVGEWHVPGVLELTATDGKTRRIRYLKEFNCGLGRGYIGKTLVTFVIADDYTDLARDGIAAFQGLKFPNPQVASEFEVMLPKLKLSFNTANSMVLTIAKPREDMIRMRDLLEYCGGKIDPKHVAWIINRILHLANCLAYNNLSHGDLSLDSLFVSPANHSVSLLGGWWYTVPIGKRMARVQPSRTLAYLPQSILSAKLGDRRTDLELVRLIGREILGDESGTKLVTDKTIPQPMVEWLRAASGGDAVEDYTRWPIILKSIFGDRRFIEMPVTFSDVYKEL